MAVTLCRSDTPVVFDHDDPLSDDRHMPPRSASGHDHAAVRLFDGQRPCTSANVIRAAVIPAVGHPQKLIHTLIRPGKYQFIASDILRNQPCGWIDVPRYSYAALPKGSSSFPFECFSLFALVGWLRSTAISGELGVIWNIGRHQWRLPPAE